MDHAQYSTTDMSEKETGWGGDSKRGIEAARFSYSSDSSLAEKGGVQSQRPLKPFEDKKPTKPVYKLQTWMSTLDDEVPLSALSIPGTHDSCAYTSTWPFISTQNMSIKKQLYAGVRYFDFRLGLVADELQMVHGTATLGLKFGQVLEVIYSWLREHQSEALIIQIKQDKKTDNESTITFADAVVAILGKDKQYWRTWCTTPSLGEVRGRIQLFRRFSESGRRLVTFGINVTRWQDNPELPFTIHTWPGSVRLTIQDHYSVSSPVSLPNMVLQKGGDVARTLSLAIQDPDPEHWYINFTSAFEINVYYQLNPRQIALGGYYLFRWVDGINVRLFGTLKGIRDDCRKGVRARYGIIVMDFPELPEQDLLQSVVDSNFPAPGNGSEGEFGVEARKVGLVVLLLLLLLVMLVILMLVPDLQSTLLHGMSKAARLVGSQGC